MRGHATSTISNRKKKKAPVREALCLHSVLTSKWRWLRGPATSATRPTMKKGPRLGASFSAIGQNQQLGLVAGVRNHRQQRKSLHAAWKHLDHHRRPRK